MRRKSYPKEFKEQIIRTEEIGSVHAVTKRHEIAPTTIYGWIKTSDNNHKAWKKHQIMLSEWQSIFLLQKNSKN